MKNRSVRLHDKISSTLLSLERLKKEISKYESQEGSALHLCNQYFKDSISDLDRLCLSYYELGDTSKADRKILEETKKKVTNINVSELCEKINTILNQNHNNIIFRLSQGEPQLNELELNIYTLFAAGMSHNSIAFILGLDPKNLYNKKSYIKKKLRKLSPETSTDSLNLMQNPEL